MVVAGASSPAVREATLHGRLLGGFDLRRGDAPLPPLDSARAESLLAYLLLHRDAPQPRAHLAFLLWPDSTEPQARTNLRHVLHNLRRALPDADRYLDVRPRSLQWRADAPLWLDVVAFEEAVAEGRWETAVEAYSGDLLEGWADEWVVEARQRLARLHADALARAAAEREAQRDWPAAIRHAERLVRADPLREDAYRQLIRLHAATGESAQALRAYHVCAATLQRELGVEPAEATRATYEALLPAEPAAGGEAASGRPPLVGRTAEREQLVAAWRAAARGRAQLLLVTGEAGIGKTRLVEELRSWCAHRGAVTADARAYPAEGAMAHGVAVSWLRSEAVSARLGRLGRPDRSELARLLPELLAADPRLPPPAALPESSQRQRLLAAIARALLPAGKPVLLVADDLQWCDVQTLQLVHYLVRSHPEAPLLVAATARPEDLDARQPASGLVTALQALDRASEIALRRLDRADTALLAERVGGHRLLAADVERLHADSEGNPLFILEALRGGGTSGASPTVQAIITTRLAQLSASAGELIGVAATIGREFTSAVLAEASGADERTFVRDLDELWRRGLVRAHGPRAYDFSHGKIREAAYRALSPVQAAHHHRRVAVALARAGDADEASGAIAAHFDHAGASREAIAWYTRAADAAQRLHANADAVHYLERALALTADLPVDARAAEELRVLTALPGPLIAVEGYACERLTTVHERALRIADEHGADLEPPLVRSIAMAHLTRGGFDAARVFGQQLQDRAERDGDEVLHVEADYVLGVAAFWQGKLADARRRLARAVERYRPEQGPVHVLRYGQDPRVFCLIRLAYTDWLLGRDAGSGAGPGAAPTLVEQSDHPYTRAVAHVWLGLLAVDQRDGGALRRHVDALRAGDADTSPAQISLPAAALAGLLDVLDGAGRDQLGRMVDDARAAPPPAPGVHAVLTRILLEADALCGDAAAGLATTAAALGMGQGAQLWEAEIRRLRALFLTRVGAAVDEATAELDRAIAVARAQGARRFAAAARATLDEIRSGTPTRNAAGTVRAAALRAWRPGS